MAFYTNDWYAQKLAEKRARQQQREKRYQEGEKKRQFETLMNTITSGPVQGGTQKNRRLLDIYNRIHNSANIRAENAYRMLQADSEKSTLIESEKKK